MSYEEVSQWWEGIRAHLLNDFPPSYYPERTVEILDACRASEVLRHTFPYISIGRLGIWRVNPDEAGYADFFWCFYGKEDYYVVANYADTKKKFFDTPEAAASFVEHHLHDENHFD